MADDNTRDVEPEEIDLTSDDGGQQGMDAPRGGAEEQSGDDEIDGAMDAIARSIDEGDESGEDVAGFGAVHTGSREDLEPTGEALPIEADPLEGPAVGRRAAEDRESDGQNDQGQGLGERRGGPDNGRRGGEAEDPAPAQPDVPEQFAIAEPEQPERDQPQAPEVARPPAAAPAQAATASQLAAEEGAEAANDGDAEGTPGTTADDATPDTPVTSGPDVTPVLPPTPAVAPTLTLGASAGPEDTAIAIDLTSLLSGGDTSITVILSNVPDGAVLSAGTKNPDGTWTLTTADIPGLTITPPKDYSGGLEISITATSTGAGGDTATVTGTLPVSVVAVADAPTLSATATAVAEDQPIPLTITTALTDTDGSEVLSVVISGLPDDVTLSAGIKNADGTWSLTPGQLTGLTMTPPEGFSGTIDFTVTSTSTEQSNGDAASVSTPVSVSIGAIADAPTLSATAAEGPEDTAIALNISAALVDTDGSEILSITIAGVPATATLSAGTKNADGTWTLTPDQLTGLTLTPGLHDADDFVLKVTATSQETSNGDTASTVVDVPVKVVAVADQVQVTATATASGDEDTAIPLTITTSTPDLDGSETISLVISGVPVGAVLSAGTKNADGTWSLTPNDLTGLTITPPEHGADDFTLTVTSRTTEAENGSYTEAVSTVAVTVNAVADAPELTLADIEVAETATHDVNVIPLNIGAVLPDADGSETLSVIISGVPADWTLSAGTNNNDGTWTLTGAQVAGLTASPPADYSILTSAAPTFTVTATSTEDENGDTAVSTGSFTVTVTPTSDAATIDGVDVGGDEGARVKLDLSAVQTDADGPVEVLGVAVTGLPAGFQLVKADGTVLDPAALDPAALDDVYIEPIAGNTAAENFSGSIPLGLQVTSTDGTADPVTVSDPFTVSYAGVADAPTLTQGAVARGPEDTAIALDLTSALTDTDGSESLSITITGVPGDSVLSAGTKNADGSWTLTQAQLAGLTLTPGEHDASDFTLRVTATSTEADTGETASTSIDVAVTVDGVADGVTLTGGPVAGVEGVDGTHDMISLGLGGTMPDMDGSESVTLVLSSADLPAGTEVYVGATKIAANPDGSWTLEGLTLDQLGTVAVKVDADYAGDFHMQVKGRTVEDDALADQSDDSTLNIAITVDPRSDAIVEHTSTADKAAAGWTMTMKEDNADPDNGDHTGGTSGAVFRPVFTLNDTDDAAGDGVETVTNISFFTNDPGVVGSQWYTETGGVRTVFTVEDAGGYESGGQTFQYRIVITDAPTALAGSNGDQWTVENLHVLPAADSHLDIGSDASPLMMAVTTQDVTTLDDASTLTSDPRVTLVEGRIVVEAVTDNITLSTTFPDGAPLEDSGAARPDGATAYALDIDIGLTDANGTGAYEHVKQLDIGGVPDGWSIEGATKGTQAADGTWTWSLNEAAVAALPKADGLNSPDLSGLNLIVPEHGSTNGPIDFSVRVVWQDTPQAGDVGQVREATDTFSVNIQGVVDGAEPLVNVAAQGTEDTRFAVNLGITQIDTDGSETLTVTLANVAEGSTFYNAASGGAAVGTKVGTTWTFTADELATLHIKPPSNFSGDMAQIGVTVTTVENNGQTSVQTATLDVAVTPDADKVTFKNHSLTGSNATDEDQVIDYAPVITLGDKDGSESIVKVVIRAKDVETVEATWEIKNAEGVWEVVSFSGNDLTIPAHAIVPVDGQPGAFTFEGVRVTPRDDDHMDLDFQLRVDVRDDANITSSGVVTAVTDAALSTANGKIQVDAVTDDLALAATDVSANEDSGTAGADGATLYALNITATLSDDRGPTFEQVKQIDISGVPDGWSIAGAEKVGGVWRLDEAAIEALPKLGDTKSPDLSGLSLVVPKHASTDGPITLTVDATWRDVAENTSTTETKQTTFEVDIDPVADQAPLVVKDLRTSEDGPVDLYIKTSLVDTDGSEVLSIIVEVPEGVSLGYGTTAGAFQTLEGLGIGTRTVSGGKVTYEFSKDALDNAALGHLKLLPPTDSNEDFTIDITAKTVESYDQAGEPDSVSLNTKTVSVEVRGVADGTDLAPGAEIIRTGIEDELVDLRLDEVPLGDSDAAAGRGVSEKASYVLDLSDLPAGVEIVLTGGAPQDALVSLGNDRWAVNPDYLGNVSLKPTKDFSNDYDGDGVVEAGEGSEISFKLEVRTTENDGDSTLSAHDVVIAVKPVIDPVTNAASPDGLEDEDLSLVINLGTTDSDGSEQVDAAYLTTEIDGFTVFNGATELTWNAAVAVPGTAVTGAYVDGSGQPVDIKDAGTLTLKPIAAERDDVAGDQVDYALTVIVSDHSVTDVRTVSGSIDVNPVADTPVVAGEQANPVLDIGNFALLNLTQLTTGEEGILDGGLVEDTETLSIVIGNIPDGAVLLLKNASGDYELAGRNNGDGTWKIPPSSVEMIGQNGNAGSITVWAPWGANTSIDGTTFTASGDDISALTVSVTVIADEDNWSGAFDKASTTISVDLEWTESGPNPHTGGSGGDWMHDALVTGIEDVATALHLGTPPAEVAYVKITMDAADLAELNAGALADGSVGITGPGVVYDGAGVWTVPVGSMGTVTLTMPEDYAGVLEGAGRGMVDLTVEAFGADDASQGTFTRDVSIKPVADTPDMPATGAVSLSGLEDGAVSLASIVAVNTDGDGSESLSYIIRVPRGFELTGAADQLNDPATPVEVVGADGQPVWALVGGNAQYDEYAVDSLDGISIQAKGSVAGAPNWAGDAKVYVSAVSTELEGGQAQSAFTPYTVTFTPVADGGVVTATVAAATEDDLGSGQGAIVDLGLSFTLPDADSETFDHAAISGANGDGTVSVGGVVIGKLVWWNDATSAYEDVTDPATLTQQQFEGLHLQVNGNVAGDVPLSAQVFTQDGADVGAGPAKAITVSIAPEVDGPILTITDASGTASANSDTDVTRGGASYTGAEDTAIALDLSAALVDTDGSEVMTILLDIPVGAALVKKVMVGGEEHLVVVGNNTGDGRWMVTPADLVDLHIVPPADFNGTMSITATATGWEKADRTVTEDASLTFSVEVTPVADAPDMEPADSVAGTEDQGIVLNLGLTKGAGNENLVLTIADLPQDATFQLAGAPLTPDTVVDNGNGTVTVTFSTADTESIRAAGADAFTLTPPADSADDFTIRVKVESVDGDSTAHNNGEDDDGFRSVEVKVTADADAPDLTLSDGSVVTGVSGSTVAVSGDEGSAIALNLGAALTDTDGSESLSVRIEGVPDGAVLSAGTNLGGGVWSVAPAALAGLTVTSADTHGTFTLTVTVTSTEADGGDTAITSGSVEVTVAAVADGATLDQPADVNAAEGSAVALDVAASLKDLDGSENLILSFSAPTAPAGAEFLYDGTPMTEDAGTWSVELTQADLDGGALSKLTFQAGDDAKGTYAVTVTAQTVETSNGAESATVQKTFTIDVTPLADAPELSYDQDATATGGGPVNLGLVAALSDASETLTVIITEVPEGGVLTLEGAETVTLNVGDAIALDRVGDLSFTPPEDAADGAQFTIGVKATSAELDGDGAVLDSADSMATITVTVQADAEGIISGLIVDPYIAGATVFIDLDRDGVHDADEPTTLTDASGAYSFAGVDGAEGAPIVAYGGVDTGTGLALAGTLSSQGGGIVTPLTTLMQSLVDRGIVADSASAQQWVADKLGLNLEGIDLATLDPVAGTEAGDPQAAAVLKAGMLVQGTVGMLSAVLDAAGGSLDAAGTGQMTMNAIVDALEAGGVSGLTSPSSALIQAVSGAGEAVNVEAATAALADANAALMASPDSVEAMAQAVRDGTSAVTQAAQPAPEEEEVPEEEVVPEEDLTEEVAEEPELTDEGGDAPLAWDAFLSDEADSPDAAPPAAASADSGEASSTEGGTLAWDAFLSSDDVPPMADETGVAMFDTQTLSEVPSASMDGDAGLGTEDMGSVGLDDAVSTGVVILPDVQDDHSHAAAALANSG